jgi:ABC-type branched-subunit amino acid transport system ATPase component
MIQAYCLLLVGYVFREQLCGFIKPSAGRLLWDGVDLSQPGLYDLYRPNVHLVAAKDAIKKALTVYENVVCSTPLYH